jgi:adenine-specific DNA-methyltransferase
MSSITHEIHHERSLTDFAAIQQANFDASTSPAKRKLHGHFGTPIKIAEFMASMIPDELPRQIRFLDPGAGVGTLTAAFCDRVVRHKTRKQVYCELWENDPTLVPLLTSTMRQCQDRLCDAGHELKFDIRQDDFILAHGQRSLFDSGPEARFDLVITNPPYFKLRKNSSHARAMAHIVHGQPNIYSLFMAVATELLVDAGQLIAITPRSYFNGLYFRRFRQWFFDRMSVKRIHTFHSRKEAFRGDEVLQENVILHAIKSGPLENVMISSSQGADLEDRIETNVPYEQVIDGGDRSRVVRLITDKAEQKIVEAVDRLTDRLSTLGLAVSTGPVVSFRATRFLRDEPSPSTAPLLWMHNVRPFKTQFPPKKRKSAHILVCEESLKLLVPAKNYVLLKRFTSKEEQRRLVAGVFRPRDCYSTWLGLENHLNYVYQVTGELSRELAYGVAAYFNSGIVDRYFRSISGNTQVNAVELRSLPMLPRFDLEALGKMVLEDLGSCTDRIEPFIFRRLGLSEPAIEVFLEVNG